MLAAKKGVGRPTVDHLPQFPLYRITPSCLGQWSATYV